MKRLILALLIVCGLVGPFSAAFAITMKKTPRPISNLLVPHRAIYEITLANKKQAVAVSGVLGRMVFEVTGSSCDGYTQNMRMITRITDERGKHTLSDIRSSTWEKGSGGRFRFTSSQYFNRALQEVVSGSADRNRKTGDIVVKIKKPNDAALDLPSDVLFPTQHSLAILRAAMAGKQRMDVRIYDGSEQGQGFYQTYCYIGNKSLPQKNNSKNPSPFEDKQNKLGLANMPSWPVAISYYNGKGPSDDSLPSYELSFRLYPNGVSRNLLINYGNFSVRGVLDRIKYLPRSSCNPKKRRR